MTSVLSEFMLLWRHAMRSS